ncbi:MAG TPA: hypothetical protein VGB60_11050 [Brevundimonas sp.]|jgi:hypothetical protein|uniref:hypothetical protein n=1 Tax=Brevundimonas sp. TaxID=1871086 RepID=UPI002EDA2BA1
MFARLTRTTAAAAALAAAGALALPSGASAQTYSYQGQPSYGYGQRYDYDRYPEHCQYDRGSRQGGGAVIGGTLGAIAGSQLAARGRRTEGSILGGVLGAAIGAGVGGDSACARGSTAYDYRYDQSRYGDDYRYRSDNRGYDYDRGYDDRRYDNDQRYDYDRYNSSGRTYDRYDRSYSSSYGHSSSCRTVEVRSRDHYGRVVTRYEQSCPDRY